MVASLGSGTATSIPWLAFNGYGRPATRSPANRQWPESIRYHPFFDALDQIDVHQTGVTIRDIHHISAYNQRHNGGSNGHGRRN
jgi:hypothetical protein